jgi:hypothetical protein
VNLDRISRGFYITNALPELAVAMKYAEEDGFLYFDHKDAEACSEALKALKSSEHYNDVVTSKCSIPIQVGYTVATKCVCRTIYALMLKN